MGQQLSIVQIVGFQNSGKTTVVQNLIQHLNKDGYVVGTIKHHGHGGEPFFGDQGKDTELHRLAGASVVTIEGNGTIQLTSTGGNWDLHKMIKLYESIQIDIVIVEGYKHEKFPKVVLIQNEDELSLLHTLTNIKCVITMKPITQKEIFPFPFFLRDETELYIDYLTNLTKGEHQ